MLHFSSLKCLQKISPLMLICGKPIRFGNKIWVLESSDGYPNKFETYTGACDTKDSSKPLGPQVASAFLSIVENLFVVVFILTIFLHLITYCEICTKRISGLLDYTRRP